jgi:TRAP transporter TAXI family solute receptor
LVIPAVIAAACNDFIFGVGREDRLTLAAGPPESTAGCLARSFAAAFNEDHPDSRMRVLGTAGAADSLVAAREGQAELAIATADTLAEAVNGEGAFEHRTVSARTLATLYPSSVYVIVAADSAMTGLSRLRDVRVGVGPHGSGMELTATRILTAARLESRVTLEPLPWNTLLERFRAQRLPAIFWVDGSPSPAIATAAAGMRLRLLNTSSVVPLLQSRYGQGLYASSEQILAPSFDSTWAGVAAVSTVLVSRHDLADDAAFSVTSALFRLSGTLARACPAISGLTPSVGAQPQPAALHAGAALFYRQGR